MPTRSPWPTEGGLRILSLHVAGPSAKRPGALKCHEMPSSILEC